MQTIYKYIVKDGLGHSIIAYGEEPHRFGEEVRVTYTPRIWSLSGLEVLDVRVFFGKVCSAVEVETKNGLLKNLFDDDYGTEIGTISICKA